MSTCMPTSSLANVPGIHRRASKCKCWTHSYGCLCNRDMLNDITSGLTAVYHADL